MVTTCFTTKAYQLRLTTTWYSGRLPTRVRTRDCKHRRPVMQTWWLVYAKNGTLLQYLTTMSDLTNHYNYDVVYDSVRQKFYLVNGNDAGGTNLYSVVASNLSTTLILTSSTLPFVGAAVTTNDIYLCGGASTTVFAQWQGNTDFAAARYALSNMSLIYGF